jgi:hypothetical protein
VTRLDTESADRAAAEDRRYERDREREPHHRHPRCVRPVPATRGAYQASVQDSVNRSKAIRLTCPHAGCLGAVYVPGDSDRERVVCAACTTTLITRRSLDGDISLQELPDAE